MARIEVEEAIREVRPHAHGLVRLLDAVLAHQGNYPLIVILERLPLLLQVYLLGYLVLYLERHLLREQVVYLRHLLLPVYLLHLRLDLRFDILIEYLLHIPLLIVQ